jgi:hypothetical protein
VGSNIVMEKEFIPYEQALELKELGFDEPCIMYYNTDKDNNYSINDECNISAPLYQQAFRWFREKYNLNASVYPLNGKFSSQIYDIFRGCYITKIDLYETYEEAELECLKKLIEIVKEK